MSISRFLAAEHNMLHTYPVLGRNICVVLETFWRWSDFLSNLDYALCTTKSSEQPIILECLKYIGR